MVTFVSIPGRVTKKARAKFDEMYEVYKSQIDRHAQKFTGLKNYDVEDVKSTMLQCLLRVCMLWVKGEVTDCSFKTAFWRTVHQGLRNIQVSDKLPKRNSFSAFLEDICKAEGIKDTEKAKARKKELREVFKHKVDKPGSVSLEQLCEKRALNDLLTESSLEEEHTMTILSMLVEDGVSDERLKLTEFQKELCHKIVEGFNITELRKEYGIFKVSKAVRLVRVIVKYLPDIIDYVDDCAQSGIPKQEIRCLTKSKFKHVGNAELQHMLQRLEI